MDNYAIADQLSMLSKLMDIHGDNPFKSKSYSSAAFTLEKYPSAVAGMPQDKVAAIRGIGQSVAAKITELLDTGAIGALQELIAATPQGVLQMMQVKGLGPKKIHTIWKELHIDTIDELVKACQENRLAATKGFGEKTEQKILESIQFKQQQQGQYLYVQVEPFAEALTQKLAGKFKKEQLSLTGAFRRQLEVIDTLEWVTSIPAKDLQQFFNDGEVNLVSESNTLMEWRTPEGLLLRFHLANAKNFASLLFETTGSPEFLKGWESAGYELSGDAEATIFKNAGLPFIHPARRETVSILQQKPKDALLEVADIKGLIHSHSTWSDGGYDLEEMAASLVALGFEYLVISDHSKAAYYANGLDEKRIREQHKAIDALNKKRAPFHIYKSIECDILSDGTMDYTTEVLASFDLVIASIHSNLDMAEDKAMQRIMGAVNNPYVDIMGHLTGRLLTRRKGYPVDHKAIIDACAQNGTVIEINANPNRLDMDWRWVEYALSKGLTLSVNPDAHTIEEFHNIKYGVLVAQKGGLTPARNLSSFSKAQFDAWLATRPRNLK